MEAEDAGTCGGFAGAEDGLAGIAPPGDEEVFGGAAVCGEGCEVCGDGADAFCAGSPATLLPMLSICAPISWRCERRYGTLASDAATTRKMTIATISPLWLRSSSGSDCPETQGEREKSSPVFRGGNNGRGGSLRRGAAGVCVVLGLFSGVWAEILGAGDAGISGGMLGGRGIAEGRLSTTEASPATISAPLVSAGEATDSSRASGCIASGASRSGCRFGSIPGRETDSTFV